MCWYIFILYTFKPLSHIPGNFELPINLKMSLVRHNMKTSQRKASAKFKSSCYEEMVLNTINFLCAEDVLKRDDIMWRVFIWNNPHSQLPSSRQLWCIKSVIKQQQDEVSLLSVSNWMGSNDNSKQSIVITWQFIGLNWQKSPDIYMCRHSH